jgi:hypothetical protein
MKSLITSSLLVATASATGFMLFPPATYFDVSGRTNYITRVDAKAMFPGYRWDWGPDDNAAEYQRLVNNGGIIQPLKEFMDQRINGCPMNDLSVVVGTFNATTMEFINDQAHEGLVRSHSGPCEIWIDNSRVFSDMNCAAHYTSYPAKLPVDYSVCKSGTCTLSFYWLAMHEPFWQLFKHCVTISNSQVSSATVSSPGYDTATTYVSPATPNTTPVIPTTPTITSAEPITAAPIQKCHIRTTQPAATVQPTTDTHPSETNAITDKFIVDGGIAVESRGVAITGAGISLSMQYSPRIYMLNKDGSKYQMFNLNNKKMSFDVDLSAVPCDYNFAVYFSEMKQSESVGHGYCDAQGQGYACSEMDIFEGNTVSMHFTSHPCTGSSCDRDGVVQEHYFNGATKVGVETKFFTTNNELSYIEQILSWNGQTYVHSIKETGSYGGLKQMGQSFNNGMVLVISIWTAGAGGMTWMNGKCGSYSYDTAGIFGTVSNLRISDI